MTGKVGEFCYRRPVGTLIENCGQTAADEDMVAIDSLYEIASALFDGIVADPLRLTITHDWHTIVRYDLSKSSIFMSFDSQYATYYQ